MQYKDVLDEGIPKVCGLLFVNAPVCLEGEFAVELSALITADPMQLRSRFLQVKVKLS